MDLSRSSWRFSIRLLFQIKESQGASIKEKLTWDQVAEYFTHE